MINYNIFTLDNGLKVVYNHDPYTAMVAVNILYNVGARDEHSDMTGIAHLLEHLMFAGSANIPDFDDEMERAGGINNAWTSNDFTNFYDVAPKQNLDTLLWLESDRMLALSFSEKSLEIQRSVVIEEFKQTHLNRPYGDMAHHLRSLLYQTHPYRYPTIGKDISHLEKITIGDIKEFFYSHYAPNNAVMAISGNVSLEEVKDKVGKWFGDIPRRNIAPRLYSAEAPIVTSHRLEVSGKVPFPQVIIAYPMPGYGEKGYIECDLLTDLLASGRSSRLYRNLVMNGNLFSAADASISGSEEPGFLMLKGTLNDNSNLAILQAERMLTEQALNLTRPFDECKNAIGSYEVQRAINRFASDFTFSSVNYLSRAQALAMSGMHGEDINSIVPAYSKITSEELTAAAQLVIAPAHSCTLVYRPN
ncbi:MAG: insulinase family protein [Duncaniella sp.]|nr:insulinase family protein [Muribaculum sp.]MCM1255328.1 insulinase family protein [Duncaniella sp.]